jgi:hypothetical protein
VGPRRKATRGPSSDEGNDCLNDLNDRVGLYACGGGTDKHEYGDGALIASANNITGCEIGGAYTVTFCVSDFWERSRPVRHGIA